MNESKEVVLVLPDGTDGMSLGAAKLCELFVVALLEAEDAELRLSVDEHHRSVEVNDQGVRRLLIAFLGAGKFPDLYRQLKDFSFPHDGGFELKVIADGIPFRLLFREPAAPPALRWRIDRQLDRQSPLSAH